MRRTADDRIHTEKRATYVVTTLVRRRQRTPPPQVKSPSDVYQIMRRRMKDLDREHFMALFLNTKNAIVEIATVSIGSLNASIVHPREILKPAIVASAASIILVHNHPTGDPAPSREDIEFTRRFAKCGELIGIELLDHVVIGDRSFYSLKETGSF